MTAAVIYCRAHSLHTPLVLTERTRIYSVTSLGKLHPRVKGVTVLPGTLPACGVYIHFFSHEPNISVIRGNDNGTLRPHCLLGSGTN